MRMWWTLLVILWPYQVHTRYNTAPDHLCPAISCQCNLLHLYIDCSNLPHWPSFDGSASLYQTLDLSGISSGVRSLSQSDFCTLHNLTSLSVSGSGISQLRSGTFREMSYLRHLDLSRNVISYSLGQSTFIGLVTLRTLNMSGSVLSTSIGAATFIPLINLHTLDMSWGNLRNIYNHTFVGLTNVRKLDVSQNVVRYIQPGSFLPLMSLHTLNLAGNRLYRLGNDTLEGLDELRHLDLSHNSLVHLHSDVLISCPKLYYLSLRGHFLTLVEADLFRPILELQYLDIRASGHHQSTCKVCPDTLTYLRQVRRVRGLPAASPADGEKRDEGVDKWREEKKVCRGREKDLSTLSLNVLPGISYCPGYDYATLPPHLRTSVEPCHCTAPQDDVKMIDCRYSNWPILPPVSHSLTGYHQLIMDGNQLKEPLTFDALAGVAGLRLLRLSGCGLTSTLIEDGALGALRWLETLDLTQNPLGELRRDMFSGLGELQVLLLNNSGVTYFDVAHFPSLFADLDKLYYLDVSGVEVVDSSASGYGYVSPRIYLPKLQNLVMSRLQHHHFPPLNLPSLLSLDLSYNTLTHVPSDTFQHMKWLQRLDISHNHIEMLNDSAFAGDVESKLTRLYYINLANNYLSEVQQHGEMCRRLPQLNTLNLAFNRFVNITSHFLNGCRNIYHLILSHNYISSIEVDAFDSLHSLRDLDLTGNNFQVLEASSFSSLSTLNTLRLQRNKFKSIHHEAFLPLRNLEHLDLRATNVAELPIKVGFLGEIRNLRTLWLSSSNIRWIPTHLLANLTSLWHLEISNNQLQDIYPDALRDLKSLLTLNLHNNRMHWIHNSFQNLTSLHTLHLCGNKLEVVKFKMIEGPDIRVIDLSSNLIKCVADGAFFFTKKLEDLDLSGNQLTTLTNDALYKLRQLQRLNLDCNNIHYFTNLSFYPATSLNTLLVRANDLEQLDGYLFERNARLRYVSVQANPLTKVCGRTNFARRVMVEEGWPLAQVVPRGCYVYGWPRDKTNTCQMFWHKHTSAATSKSGPRDIITIIIILLLMKTMTTTTTSYHIQHSHI